MTSIGIVKYLYDELGSSAFATLLISRTQACTYRFSYVMSCAWVELPEHTLVKCFSLQVVQLTSIWLWNAIAYQIGVGIYQKEQIMYQIDIFQLWDAIIRISLYSISIRMLLWDNWAVISTGKTTAKNGRAWRRCVARTNNTCTSDPSFSSWKIHGKTSKSMAKSSRMF